MSVSQTPVLLLEVLVEDRSGSRLLAALLPRMLRTCSLTCDLRIRPHRGLGYRLPKKARELSPGRAEAKRRAAAYGGSEELRLGPELIRSRGGGLYNLLDAKLRAYERYQRERPLVVLIVQDADREAPADLESRLRRQVGEATKELITVIGIAVEELEAWMLADPVALFRAYPTADRSYPERYVQDSVIGTWEFLAEVLLGKSHAAELKEQGYPLIGKYKYEWARRIGPQLRPERMHSPSFRRFEKHFHAGIERLGRGAVHEA